MGKPTTYRAEELEDAIVRLWKDRLGVVLVGDRLWRALGFGSRRAFERAAARHSLGVRLYLLPGGRGRYVKTEDAAREFWRNMINRHLGGEI